MGNWAFDFIIGLGSNYAILPMNLNFLVDRDQGGYHQELL